MDNGQSHLSLAISSELEDLSKAIAADLSERAKIKKLLENITKALGENNIEQVDQLLNKGSSQLSDKYPQAKSTLQKLQVDVNRRIEEQLRQTYIQLEEYCRDGNIPYKGSGTKYVVDTYIDVELDRKNGRSKVGILSISTLKWHRILEALESERARLWKRGFNPGEFRDRLVRAYQELEGTGPKPTTWSSLDGVYQVLKREKEKENPGWKQGGRLVSYYKDEFSVDLSLLWMAQASREIGLPYIELSAIRDPRRAYKVLQPDSNIGFFGFLRPGGT